MDTRPDPELRMLPPSVQLYSFGSVPFPPTCIDRRPVGFAYIVTDVSWTLVISQHFHRPYIPATYTPMREVLNIFLSPYQPYIQPNRKSYR